MSKLDPSFLTDFARKFGIIIRNLVLKLELYIVLASSTSSMDFDLICLVWLSSNGSLDLHIFICEGGGSSSDFFYYIRLEPMPS